MYQLQLCEFVDKYCIADYMQELLYRRSPARKINDVSGCDVLMDINTGIQIGNNSFILINSTLINLGYHAGCIRVRCYAGKSYLLKCLNEHHSVRTTKVIVWFAIAQHARSQMYKLWAI